MSTKPAHLEGVQTGIFSVFLPWSFAIVDGMAGSASVQPKRFGLGWKWKDFDLTDIVSEH